jgi:hypothetical protein
MDAPNGFAMSHTGGVNVPGTGGVHDEYYDNRVGFGKISFSGSWRRQRGPAGPAEKAAPYSGIGIFLPNWRLV